MRLLTVLIILISVVGMAGQALPIFAAEAGGVHFSDTYVADGNKLNLIGVGLLRYWGFKVYSGALYLEAGVDTNAVLADKAKRIEIEYMRAIKGKDFGPATDKSIARNIDGSIYQRLRPQIAYHNSLYEDVQPGDRYALTYIPGKGTELSLNGEPKGIIPGSDFAAAVFSIWLGPEPINPSFKEQILGL